MLFKIQQGIRSFWGKYHVEGLRKLKANVGVWISGGPSFPADAGRNTGSADKNLRRYHPLILLQYRPCPLWGRFEGLATQRWPRREICTTGPYLRGHGSSARKELFGREEIFTTLLLSCRSRQIGENRALPTRSSLNSPGHGRATQRIVANGREDRMGKPNVKQAMVRGSRELATRAISLV